MVMRQYASVCLFCLLLVSVLQAAKKPHVITLGKWQTVKWVFGASDATAIDLKVRGVFVDGKLKEYAVGPTHEVTENLFVIRRAFRVNDALPGEDAKGQWRWERGGWLLVDRGSGRISAITLPLMDSFYSMGTWYRDYVAYCGLSDDGKKIYAVITQLGRHKPLLRKSIGVAEYSEIPDSACLAPRWERAPIRVTFEAKGADKMVYELRTRALDMIDNDEEDQSSD
jgi:hypothetical protein